MLLITQLPHYTLAQLDSTHTHAHTPLSQAFLPLADGSLHRDWLSPPSASPTQLPFQAHSVMDLPFFLWDCDQSQFLHWSHPLSPPDNTDINFRSCSILNTLLLVLNNDISNNTNNCSYLLGILLRSYPMLSYMHYHIFLSDFSMFTCFSTKWWISQRQAWWLFHLCIPQSFLQSIVGTQSIFNKWVKRVRSGPGIPVYGSQCKIICTIMIKWMHKGLVK